MSPCTGRARGSDIRIGRMSAPQIPRSHSAPELGKACNPLRRYTGDALATISREEEEAERLYYAVASASLPKRAFTVLAKDLDRRSADAGAYLTWLILRGWQWPTVAAANVNAVP